MLCGPSEAARQGLAARVSPRALARSKRRQPPSRRQASGRDRHGPGQAGTSAERPGRGHRLYCSIAGAGAGGSKG